MRVLYITFFIVFADQASKLLVKGFSIPFLNFSYTGMDLFSSINLIEDFLKITYVENPGMAFGLDIGGNIFLSFFRIAASIGIFYYLFKVRNESLFLRIPLALILGGAIGNLIDRVLYGVFYNEGNIFYGKVVDFIYLTVPKFEILGYRLNGWPIFNISDVAVFIGVLMLIIFHKKISVVKPEKSSSEIVETSIRF